MVSLSLSRISVLLLAAASLSIWCDAVPTKIQTNAGIIGDDGRNLKKQGGGDGGRQIKKQRTSVKQEKTSGNKARNSDNVKQKHNKAFAEEKLEKFVESADDSNLRQSHGSKSSKSAAYAPSVPAVPSSSTSSIELPVVSVDDESSITESPTYFPTAVKGSKSSKSSGGAKANKPQAGSHGSKTQKNPDHAMMSLHTTAPSLESKSDKPLTTFFIKEPENSSKSGKGSTLSMSMPYSKAQKTSDMDDDAYASKSGKSSHYSEPNGYGGKSEKGTHSIQGTQGMAGDAPADMHNSKTAKHPVGSGSTPSSPSPPDPEVGGNPVTPSVPNQPPTDASPPSPNGSQTTLLTLAPTRSPVSGDANSTMVQKTAPAPSAPNVPTGTRPNNPGSYPAAPSPEKDKSDKEKPPKPAPARAPKPDTEQPTVWTYNPTFDLYSNSGESYVAMEPFALTLYASNAAPRYDEESVLRVTTEHLTHSFRTNNYVVDRLNLMILKDERARRRLADGLPEYDLIFGGILYISAQSPTPTTAEINRIVEASFEGARLEYYVELLQEADLDIADAVYNPGLLLDPDSANGESNGDGGSSSSGSGGTWRNLTIGLCSAVGGIGVLALGSRAYFRKRKRDLMCDDVDGLEKGDRFVIGLKDKDEHIENFPGLNDGGGTVAPTENESLTERSVPSTIHRRKHADGSSLNSRSFSHDEMDRANPGISPLEEPADVPTRYVSVFTVKKDCGGKTLEEIDLRALVIAYLSRMLKKYPNTHLLPCDRSSDLPPIPNIRNIPDDISELENYIGNPRIDDSSGKVMFNLRVESDTPVSKMKTTSSRKSAAPVPQLKAPEKKEVSEGSEEAKGFEDVKL